MSKGNSGDLGGAKWGQWGVLGRFWAPPEGAWGVLGGPGEALGGSWGPPGASQGSLWGAQGAMGVIGRIRGAIPRVREPP